MRYFFMKKMIYLMLALVMILAMTACNNGNKETYELGVAAYQNGDFETAANLLSTVGDYKDAVQLLESIHVSKTGVSTEVTTGEGTVSTTTEYVFKNGNLIKEITTHADGTVTKNYYKYDEHGNCSSETLNHADGTKTVLSHFYEDGIKIRTIRTNPNNSKDTYVYTCDENGNVISHVLTFADNSKEEATYSYNSFNQLSVISAGSVTTTYEYNYFGDVVKETVAENGNVLSATTYTYNYQ